MYLVPKTRIGKISFWATMAGVSLLFIPYWIAMATKSSTAISLGFLSFGLIILFGTTSMVAIIKHKDKAVLLFVSALFGLFGWMMLIGEFLFPH